MKRLKLAPTIRNLRADEVPGTPSILQALEGIEDANIVEGFVIKKVEGKEGGYKFYAEINIDNDLLWLLVREFILAMPAEVALIYGNAGDEPNYGRYIDKYVLIEKLEPYNIELAQDGFLEFGIIFNDEDYLEEVFIKKAKWVQYWGIDKESFFALMDKFDLLLHEKLKFVDEFPMVTESLIFQNPSVKETSLLLETFDKMFLE